MGGSPPNPADEEKLKDLRAMWLQFKGKPSLVDEAEALASQIEHLKAKVAAAKPVATRLQGALARRERLAKDVLSAADAVASATATSVAAQEALELAKGAHAKALGVQEEAMADISVLQQELAATSGPSGPSAPAGPSGPLADMAVLTSDLSANQLEALEAHKGWVLHTLRGITNDLCEGLRAQAPDGKRPASPDLRPHGGAAEEVGVSEETGPRPMELSGSESPVRQPAAKFSKLAEGPSSCVPLTPTHPDPPVCTDASASSLLVTPTVPFVANPSSVVCHPEATPPTAVATVVDGSGDEGAALASPLRGEGGEQGCDQGGIEPSGSDGEYLEAALSAEAHLAVQAALAAR